MATKMKKIQVKRKKGRHPKEKARSESWGGYISTKGNKSVGTVNRGRGVSLGDRIKVPPWKRRNVCPTPFCGENKFSLKD